MNIFLTLDYELFFGNPTGTVEKCILEPTDRLLEISKKYGAGMTYFVDVGFLIKLEEYKGDYPELEKDYTKILGQLHRMLKEGSDVQLHIHPHWEDCTYAEGEWKMVTNLHYKLSDYNEEKIEEIVLRYKAKLEEYIDRSVNSFRAGGWCLQPFSDVRDAFLKAGIKYDTTVFQGGEFKSEHYYFDFTKAPSKGKYKFSTDLVVEDNEGEFTELPIGGMKYHPFFYWKLYGWGRVRPSRHKMLGDGNFISQPGRKQNHLKKSTWNHLSMDGYFSSKLKFATKKFIKEGREDLVIIGHPKGMTLFAFEKLEAYIKQYSKKHTFKTFNQL